MISPMSLSEICGIDPPFEGTSVQEVVINFQMFKLVLEKAEGRRVKLVLGAPGGAAVRATRSPCGASGVWAGEGCGGYEGAPPGRC